MHGDEPQLSWYAAFVRRHAALLLVGALAGLACGSVWELGREPLHTASTAVLLAPVPGYVDTDPVGREPRTVTIDTDAQLLRSAEVVQPLARHVGVSPATVRDRLAVAAFPLTRVLRVSYTGHTAEQARRGADTAARLLLDARRRTLLALQPQQLAVLQSEVARRARALREMPRALGHTALERHAEQSENLTTLQERLRRLYLSRAVPGRVLQEAQLPQQAARSDPEVSMVGGLLLGLLAGCGAGRLHDARQRVRASSASTRWPNRSAAASPPAAPS